jgi:hypothetical protein
MCAAALFTLSEHFQSAALRSYAASVRREAYREAAALFDDLPEDENITVAADTAEPVDPNLPPGLGNLRNTCYLNSILQYCYTVTPIRELVLNFDPNAPGPSLDLANKNPEVYIGRECELLYPTKPSCGVSDMLRSCARVTEALREPQKRFDEIREAPATPCQCSLAFCSPRRVGEDDLPNPRSTPACPTPSCPLCSGGYGRGYSHCGAH